MDQRRFLNGPAARDNAFPAVFTIEAAFLFPFILLLFVSLIRLSFYLYDRCSYEQDAYRYCFRESIEREGGKTAASEAAYRELTTGYLVSGISSLSRSESGRWIVLEGKANAADWPAVFSRKSEKYDPPAGIRTYRRLKYVAEQLFPDK